MKNFFLQRVSGFAAIAFLLIGTNNSIAMPPIESTNSLQFSISIPQEWSSNIVRAETENAVTFNFKKTDGTTVFLLSVNKLSADDFLNVKDDLQNVKVIEQKNGLVYFAMETSKNSIKGSDSANFAKVFSHLDEMLNSIKITE